MAKKFKMIYLYVFFEEAPRQCETGPTDCDVDMVESNCLQIFRWYGNAYEYLTIQQGKPVWETVELAHIYDDAGEEIGPYHA